MFSLVSRLTLAESLKITIAASHVAEMGASQPNQRLHVLGSSAPTAQSRRDVLQAPATCFETHNVAFRLRGASNERSWS